MFTFMDKITKWVIGAVIAVLIVWGYSMFKDQSGPVVVEPVSVKPVVMEPIKIGATLPLTGEAASYGEGTKAGIDLALKEVNDAGGINGRKLEIVYEDDKCSKDGVTAIQKLVTIDKVDAIIGPVCSAAGGPGLPIAQAAKVPVIFWASAPHLTKIGDYMFRTYPSDAFQGEFAAGYLFNNLKKQKVAILYVKNDWGQGIRDVFVSEFEKLGGKIVFDDGVLQDTKDFKTVLTKLKQSDPDSIYLPVYPAGGAIAVKQMKDLAISLPILGGDAFDAEEFLKIPQAEGVMYLIGKLNNPDEFKARVKVATGKDSIVFTPLGYDGIKILAQIIKEVGTDKQAIRDSLAKLRYTEGITMPMIDFDENGDLKTIQLEVRVVKDGNGVVIQ
jgi:branched-chain amino acid transport system substrate-binding protein